MHFLAYHAPTRLHPDRGLRSRAPAALVPQGHGLDERHRFPGSLRASQRLHACVHRRRRRRRRRTSGPLAGSALGDICGAQFYLNSISSGIFRRNGSELHLCVFRTAPSNSSDSPGPFLENAQQCNGRVQLVARQSSRAAPDN
eukprot:1733565-Pleurochrysis_carterae.AAC.1